MTIAWSRVISPSPTPRMSRPRWKMSRSPCPAGGCLAIIGPSGAGKSTLAQLLLRFWDYQQGEILLGGHDLRSYNPDDARALFSVIAQDTYIFNGTIRDNLLLANGDASDEEIETAARQAQLHAFIETLPHGYDTLVGENGATAKWRRASAYRHRARHPQGCADLAAGRADGASGCDHSAGDYGDPASADGHSNNLDSGPRSTRAGFRRSCVATQRWPSQGEPRLKRCRRTDGRPIDNSTSSPYHYPATRAATRLASCLVSSSREPPMFSCRSRNPGMRTASSVVRKTCRTR